ncbi:hypothetical protein IE81DRAFT_247071 [Ceraceosorus guamensis]|uniref:Uncharacterized protein n=1 Tax=Ceraceosorus guamensis TaxID=1522189 RepID=A0A316VQW6_9BASI|nr:hypothetical protein IE81DRAFT_247071 [Ceraceosorus guamensis]PWN40007.1 hypothetical protein IE81DRAFT_247071 [Ceraceosorus guamensis]
MLPSFELVPALPSRNWVRFCFLSPLLFSSRSYSVDELVTTQLLTEKDLVAKVIIFDTRLAHEHFVLYGRATYPSSTRHRIDLRRCRGDLVQLWRCAIWTVQYRRF